MVTFRGGDLGVLDRLVLEWRGRGSDGAADISRPDQKRSIGRDNRMFVEGMLWIVRTGWLVSEWHTRGERKYYLSNRPPGTSLRDLAAAIKAR